MFASSPELINAVEINTNAFMTLSQIAFSSVERLARLNLNAATAALESSTSALGSIVKTRDATKQQGLLTSTPRTAATNAVAYLQGVQEVAAETQKEVAELVKSYFASHGGTGSNPSAGWLKGFEQFKSFAQQINDMTAANTRVVGDATARITSAVAPHETKGS